MKNWFKAKSKKGSQPPEVPVAPVIIRKAEMRDAGGVAMILRDTGWWESLNAESLDRTVGRLMSHIRQCNADHSHSVYVADVAGEVIGYVSVHWLPYLFLSGAEGYVSELFVLQKGRGKGIGTKLLHTVEKEARERGCSRLMLVNGRQRDSYKRHFYPKNGWRERKKMANFVLDLKNDK